MPTDQSALAVLLNPTCEKQCHALADILQLPLLQHDDEKTNYPFYLSVDEQGVYVQQTGFKAPGPVRVDFSGGASAYRRTKGGGELIVKAVGGDKKNRPTVLDATAGLGRDSFVLAAKGCSVVLCERSPVIYQLLQDGLQRASTSNDIELKNIAERMHLQAMDAIDFLQKIENEQRPDVVMIDPMFPPSGKSALVKKDMQAFHQLVGPDQDGKQLLEIALQKAVHRVVVKRPRKAEWLGQRKPNYALEGKAIRFDIYSLKTFSSK